MRKIYQSAPDVPQAVANKAIDIIERHFAAAGVGRADDLPEENKVRLHRDLQNFFEAELPHARKKDGGPAYDLGPHGGGFLKSVVRWLGRVCRGQSSEPDV